MTNTWIIAATGAGIAQIAESAGEDANLLVVGGGDLARNLRSAKVARLVHVPCETLPELTAARTASFLAEEGADTILAADLPAERALATAAAAKIGAVWISGAVAWDAQTRTVKRSVAGLSVETIATQGPVACVLPVSEVPAGGEAQTETLCLSASDSVQVTEDKPVSAQIVDVSKAQRVIGVGRGIARKEDLEMIYALADAIGAKVGATRPVAEGYGWFDSYIGLTGQQLTADLYFAVGISGQIHHMGGVRRAKVIVAVNEDPQAPIFAESDYGIIGDLYEIIPAVKSAL